MVRRLLVGSFCSGEYVSSFSSMSSSFYPYALALNGTIVSSLFGDGAVILVLLRRLRTVAFSVGKNILGTLRFRQAGRTPICMSAGFVPCFRSQFYKRSLSGKYGLLCYRRRNCAEVHSASTDQHFHMTELVGRHDKKNTTLASIQNVQARSAKLFLLGFQHFLSLKAAAKLSGS